MKTIKYSRQRESVKACLMSRRDHPTAEAIYASIREEYPNISLGTVYRNLNLLEELGEVRKLRCGNGPDHFDGDMWTSGRYSYEPHGGNQHVGRTLLSRTDREPRNSVLRALPPMSEIGRYGKYFWKTG